MGKNRVSEFGRNRRHKAKGLYSLNSSLINVSVFSKQINDEDCKAIIVRRNKARVKPSTDALCYKSLAQSITEIVEGTVSSKEIRLEYPGPAQGALHMNLRDMKKINSGIIIRVENGSIDKDTVMKIAKQRFAKWKGMKK